MTGQPDLAARTEWWARTMTAIPSVTGTSGEADFADALARILKESTALGRRVEVALEPVPGGPHPRKAVLALMRGSGRRTVILTGHFDVVETSGYGLLEPLAFDPDRLSAALVDAIAGEPFDARSDRARRDLAEGGFLPGRGLLDMKGGLAAGLAAMEALAGEDIGLNLLFIAVPDEEGHSAGARHVARRLPGIARAWGLDLEAAINLDAMVDDGDGAAARIVTLGSVGKLLPSALVVGRPAHASNALRGFGAAALAGALAAELEWSPDLTERTEGEQAAAPTLLVMKDDKTAYDVTMPASVWLSWNVMTHRRSPDDVLAAVEHAAVRAGASFLDGLARRANEIGADVALPDTVPVHRFADLKAEIAGSEAERELEAHARSLAASGVDIPEISRLVTRRLWQLTGRSGPAIVICFASVPYLPVELRDDPMARRLAAAVDDARDRIGARFGTAIGTVRYFPGISDVSFFGQPDETHVAAIASNTPHWDGIAGEGFAIAGIPSINAGPWGRDYHTRLERIETHYGFRVLPELIREIVLSLE